jgi:hypothetical protein
MFKENVKIITNMKKILYISLVIATLFSCRKNETKEEEPMDCCSAPFTEFIFYVDKDQRTFLERATLYRITNTSQKEEIPKNVAALPNGRDAYSNYTIRKEKNGNYFSFSINVINDMERKLGMREEVYSLEDANNQISFTIKGEFVEHPQCCATAEIRKVLINGKEWAFRKEPLIGTSEYCILDSSEILKKTNSNE